MSKYPQMSGYDPLNVRPLKQVNEYKSSKTYCCGV